ncbi:beta-ketoacyl synthase N-terminal-like domain-containing protein [uncultured Campylobacter sp.]|uniref:beta-ketoacyl synthase N-terminal-like domain-containing protein n=1 Tax=uncultured Campylobacter sp. TaxID=218934 RepID=UPI00261AD749|nr:beta-ketoacyl synthase N-terminal-like domain-containing protein [uncultured Campylobacter sp.]
MTQYLSSPGLICAGANSAAELFSALCEKRSALRKLSVCGKNFIFGRVDTPLPQIKDRAYATRTNALALYACLGMHRQIEQAVQKFGAHRVGVVFATTNTGVQENYAEFFACGKDAGNFISQDGENSAPRSEISTANSENFAKISKAANDKFKNFCFERNSHANPANFIRERFGLKSIAIGVSSACTSGNKALIEASRLISCGLCDAVVFGGADALDELTLQGFSALEILSEHPLKPFSEARTGTNLGEGACAFVLSRERISDVALLAHAANSDAYHITKPDPGARMQITAIKTALKSAQLQSVDYVNLHGTGTAANDAMEALAMSTALPLAPASSSKWATGHTLGAAGAIELAVCYEAIKQGVIPPNFTNDKILGGSEAEIFRGVQARHSEQNHKILNSESDQISCSSGGEILQNAQGEISKSSADEILAASKALLGTGDNLHGADDKILKDVADQASQTSEIQAALSKFNLACEAKKARVDTAMNLNFAFGGDNAVTIIGRV